MNHIDLFSGIGGFALAAQTVWGEDYHPVCFVEMDKFCQKVLRKNFGDVPIVEDVRDVERIVAYTMRSGAGKYKEDLRQGQQTKGRIRVESDGEDGTGTTHPYAGNTDVTLLTGGFPCQGFSVAGKQRGKEDVRYLWPEMLEIISATRPDWVIAENVTGIIKLALDTVLSDLETEGYTCQAFIIPACSQNAPHRRDRVWIVGNRIKQGLEGYWELCRELDVQCDQPGREQEKQIRPVSPSGVCKRNEDVADTEDGSQLQTNETSTIRREDPRMDVRRCGSFKDVADTTGGQREQCISEGQQVSRFSERGQRIDREHEGSTQGKFITEFCRVAPRLSQRLDRHQWNNGEWPGVPRVAVGVKDRVNRLKALGNSIVPQCVIPIMEAIKEIEYNHPYIGKGGNMTEEQSQYGESHEIVTADYVQYNKMSLIVSPDLTLPVAEVVLDRLYTTYDWSQFYIGDLIIFCNYKFGEDFAQVIDPDRYSVKTLQRFAYIADRVPPGNRREELSYSMHVEVAKLDPDSQAQWLQMAIDDKMTVSDLREAMGTKAKKEKEPRIIHFPCQHCGADNEVSEDDFK